MKTVRISILAAFAALFSACSQDSGVNAADIKYREIRIDLFSHRWATMEANAEDVEEGGRVLVRWDGGEYRLRSRSLLKPLPEHLVRTEMNQRALFYQLDPEPTSVTCLIKQTGEAMETEEEPEESSDLLYTYAEAGNEETFLYTVIYPNYVENWHSGVGGCGVYYPGKGFVVHGAPMLGEMILRY